MYSIKIKIIATTLLTVALSVNAVAQQIFKVSQYMENSFIHNPAAVGAGAVTTVGGVFRSQWAGIDGSPKTMLLFGDTYIPSKNTGVGVVLYSDKTGPTSRTGGNFNISYSVKLDGDDKKRLMMGLGAEVIQFKVDKDKIAEFIPNDPLLASSGTTIKGDASAGVYLRTPKLSVGIAAFQLIQPKLNFVKSATNVDGKLYRHFFFTASYRIITDESNVLLPHAEVRYQPNAPADYEAGIMLMHKDFLHVGVSGHYKQDYTIFAGVKIDHKFTIGYAYDLYNHPLNTFDGGNGAHELSLRYCFIK
jgi:type IX secretion system PorP/SprF family membrane protein